MKPALPLGTEVKPYGRVVSVMTIAGERYYFFSSPATPKLAEAVAMIPASEVERE